MAYLALYRQHRPKVFDQVVEQMHIVKTLTNAIESGRLSHAYIFSGPRGTGKTTIARILARSLNCYEGPSLTPCGVCASCKSIDAGTSIDVIEIDAASNRGIEDVRSLTQNLQFMSDSLYRIYIIDEVHMLTGPAFNALLKTLEEPPENSILILATTELHKVPLTILSRCQRFDFHPISTEGIFQHLQEIAEKEEIQAESAALRAIANRAQGGLRDALSLFDQCLSYAGNKVSLNDVLELLGSVDYNTLLKTVEILNKGNILGLVTLIDKVEEEGKDLKRFLNDLILFLKDYLSQPLEEIKLNNQDIVEVLQVLIEAEIEMSRSQQPKLILELALFRSGELLLSGGKIAQLETRLRAVEALLKDKTFFLSTDAKIEPESKIIETKEQIVESLLKDKSVLLPTDVRIAPEPNVEASLKDKSDILPTDVRTAPESKVEETKIKQAEDIKKTKADFSFVPGPNSIIDRLQANVTDERETNLEAPSNIEAKTVYAYKGKGEENIPLLRLQEHWDEVIEQIYKEKVSLHAIFKKGVIHKIDEKELVIVCQNDFFKKVLNQPESISLIEAVVKDKTDLNISFKAITASEANELLINKQNTNGNSNHNKQIENTEAKEEELDWIEQAALLFAGPNKTQFTGKNKNKSTKKREED